MAKFSGNVYFDLGFALKNKNPHSRHWYNPKDGSHFTDSQLRKHGFDRLVGKQYGITYGKGTDNEELMRVYNYTEIYDSGQNTYGIQ